MGRSLQKAPKKYHPFSLSSTRISNTQLPPHNSPLKRPLTPFTKAPCPKIPFYTLPSYCTMASTNLSQSIFILSLFFFSAFTSACVPCMPKPPPIPKPKPPPAPILPPPIAPPTAPIQPPPIAPPTAPKCPRDTLKLGVCVDLLGGLVNLVIGTPLSSKCCALLEGLADLEAALCLCTAIKANVLGINLNVPVTLSLLLSACEKTIPPGFQC